MGRPRRRIGITAHLRTGGGETIDKLNIVPATSTEVPATQTKYTCPVGTAAAHLEPQTIFAVSNWRSTNEGIQAIDADQFKAGGETYRYDRDTPDATHVCVKQGQAATD